MNQACPIEPGGSFLGIAVGEYQHHQSLPCVVLRTRELAVLLEEGFGYRPTVLENPTAEQLRVLRNPADELGDLCRHPLPVGQVGLLGEFLQPGRVRHHLTHQRRGDGEMRGGEKPLTEDLPLERGELGDGVRLHLGECPLHPVGREPAVRHAGVGLSLIHI